MRPLVRASAPESLTAACLLFCVHNPSALAKHTHTHTAASREVVGVCVCDTKLNDLIIIPSILLPVAAWVRALITECDHRFPAGATMWKETIDFKQKT